MTPFEQLQSHMGGLLHLKTELFWYGGRGWDGCPGRFCFLLDVIPAAAAAARTAWVVPEDALAAWTDASTAVALLLIDGQPQWVWVAEQDIEVLDEAG